MTSSIDNTVDGEQRPANSTLAIGGVSSPLDSLVVAESSVLRTNFCAENPPLRQAQKRWWQAYNDNNYRN